MALYILNPGDGRDVQTFDRGVTALAAFADLRDDAFGRPFVQLYCLDLGRLKKLDPSSGMWFALEDHGDHAPIKVLDVAKRCGWRPRTAWRPGGGS